MLQKRRLALGLLARHHQHAQRRRRAHCNQQGQADGNQEGNRQRPEEGALQAGHQQDRQKRHCHCRRGIKHGTPHFQRGGDEQFADIRARPRHAASTQDVFNIDDGIIDHDTERHH